MAKEYAKKYEAVNEKKSCCLCSRRDFLELSSKSASAIAVLGPLTTLVAGVTGCGQEPLSSGAGPGQSTVIPTSSNNLYTFNFSDYPVLQNVGGSIRVTIQATSGAKDVFITRVDSGTADTVSTICTHQGCTLNSYNASTQQYLCPCHGSVFSASGAVIVGPAVVPLPSYPTILTNSGVQVTVS